MRDRFSEFQSLGQEFRSLEYKGPAKFPLIAPQLTRTMLALSNTRDGGSIIIGMTERSDGSGYDKQGLSREELETYDPEVVRDHVARYAEPYCEFDLKNEERDGKVYVWFVVAEFRELPVLCRREWHDPQNPGGPPYLKRGALYVRPLAGRPRTVEVATAEDMREILELAHLKRVRRFVQEAVQAGLLVIPSTPQQVQDAEAFRQQRADFDT